MNNIRALLKHAKTIAVVGYSEKPERASHWIAEALIGWGYEVYLVNPLLTEGLGRRVYPDLLSIGKPMDIVDVFRRSEAVGPVVDEAIASGAKGIWFQSGVRNDQAGQRAEAAGLWVIQDDCIFARYQALLG